MNIFDLRNNIISDYASYIRSFIQIRDTTIRNRVENELFQQGFLWPEPLIQLNPLFKQGRSIDTLISQNVLHPACSRIFRRDKTPDHPQGELLLLHKHQEESIEIANAGHSYVLTTGTGSGKSLAYIIPIVNYVLRHPEQHGIKAIVVYPMNALANSQKIELEKYLATGITGSQRRVTFNCYTGQETTNERAAIIANPPDILLTNYVMLELILTRPRERDMLEATQLRFLVLDELHTYRGRQGADVALLVRRVRDRLTEAGQPLQFVGTSATLAGDGTYDAQRSEIADMATRLSGTEVLPEHVIHETLVRVTASVDEDTPTFTQQLTQRVANFAPQDVQDYTNFINDPLFIWLESTFGVTTRDGRLVRTTPRRISSLDGHRDDSAADLLKRRTGIAVARCVDVIKQALLAGYERIEHPATGRSPFAFRLHQFISKGDMVYASPEHEPQRYLTLQSQLFVPNSDRQRVLLPLVFCRECGQEYYCVFKKNNAIFISRDDLNDRSDKEGQPGFLYLSKDEPWPLQTAQIDERLPDEWKTEKKGRIVLIDSRKHYRPKHYRIRADGEIVADETDGVDCHFVSAPFRFCLFCGVSYGSYQGSDFAKLSSLSSEGRSTSTTILSLSAIRQINDAQNNGDLRSIASKMLSFTDNRQDASLQAGHFNDFIEIGLLRSALYQAVKQAGAEGLRHDTLTLRVFEAMQLPMKYYAIDEKVRFRALHETQLAFRNVLSYRLYCDLRRGWRITSPNLEQCGLLKIDYLSLEEVCEAKDIWQNCHVALQSASPETRYEIGKALLDYMRRELAIKVDYLNPTQQESIVQQSNQRLIPPWAFDEGETQNLEYATTFYSGKRPAEEGRHDRYLSGLSNFGRYLKRGNTFKNYPHRLSSAEAEIIIKQLFIGLGQANLVERVVESTSDEVHGYQLPASAIIWHMGDGTAAFHDPIRIPQRSASQRSTNPFFRDFYQSNTDRLLGITAREHTAQVSSDERREREKAFRQGLLQLLFCSPTMELGVDISELNLVNMRNIPPTPANYAQRSGRAGRSGQPALVISYCSTGSSHDQHFFRRPEDMVQGAVSPPRLDLTNEDLIRAHVYAIWLAETHLSLERSLKDLLDVSGASATLDLLPEVRTEIEHKEARQQAASRATSVLSTILELNKASWYTSTWLSTILDMVSESFDQACERWRGLYRTAQKQLHHQTDLIGDATRTKREKDDAQRLWNEAKAQLALLTNDESFEQSDFYSYRYMASEGFLPGYNFPRLPLSAYIPARRTKNRDEYLSRPRFLAISEFAPNAIIYHEGSRYVINRAQLSVNEDGPSVMTRNIKQCTNCGYLHLPESNEQFDCCDYCGSVLQKPMNNLFRLQNVSTTRRDKINSDEEERQRRGYDIRTAIRFQEQEGKRHATVANIDTPDGLLGMLSYGQSATIWRINFGLLRRENDQQGFLLDPQRGKWGRETDAVTDPSRAQARESSYHRVIPYVEDSRNCLLFEPAFRATPAQMASLQSALKSAIQLHFQLEDNELAAEPLPDRKTRQYLLFFESSEGGAGVLRQIVDDPTILSQVARKALQLCHYDADTGEDLLRADRAREECEAACYHCLMTYANQIDHRLLDRASIRDVLFTLMQAKVNYIGTGTTLPDIPALEEHKLQTLAAIEDEWLQFLQKLGYQLPKAAHPTFSEAQVTPDFYYPHPPAAIYVDGAKDSYPERYRRDLAAIEDVFDSGQMMVIRFDAQENWKKTLALYPKVFRRDA